MSHLGAEAIRRRHRRADCRKGVHDYGPTREVGAGITRRVCVACSSVSIDLTDAYAIDSPRAVFSRRARAGRGS